MGMGSGPLSWDFIDRTGPQTGTMMLNVDLFFKGLHRVLRITKSSQQILLNISKKLLRRTISLIIKPMFSCNTIKAEMGDCRIAIQILVKLNWEWDCPSKKNRTDHIIRHLGSRKTPSWGYYWNSKPRKKYVRGKPAIAVIVMLALFMIKAD